MQNLFYFTELRTYVCKCIFVCIYIVLRKKCKNTNNRDKTASKEFKTRSIVFFLH